MRNVLLWGGLALLGILGLAGAAIVLTEGGFGSSSRHVWSVTVEPDGPGAWRVEVPRILNGTQVHASGNASLAALLATLRVVEGDARAELRDDALVLAGEGRAVAQALSTPPRGSEGFSDWRVSGAHASNDATSPALRIGWRVELSGGRGHSCWGSGAWDVTLASGETRALWSGRIPPSASPDGPGPRPWDVVCA